VTAKLYCKANLTTSLSQDMNFNDLFKEIFRGKTDGK